MLNNNLKKVDIAKDLKKKIGISSNYSKKIVNDLIEIISHNINSGNFNLKNIGSFKIISKKERLGRNPKTRKVHLISERKSVIFTPSKTLTNILNKIL